MLYEEFYHLFLPSGKPHSRTKGDGSKWNCFDITMARPNLTEFSKNLNFEFEFKSHKNLRSQNKAENKICRQKWQSDWVSLGSSKQIFILLLLQHVIPADGARTKYLAESNFRRLNTRPTQIFQKDLLTFNVMMRCGFGFSVLAQHSLYFFCFISTSFPCTFSFANCVCQISYLASSVLHLQTHTHPGPQDFVQFSHFCSLPGFRIEQVMFCFLNPFVSFCIFENEINSSSLIRIWFEFRKHYTAAHSNLSFEYVLNLSSQPRERAERPLKRRLRLRRKPFQDCLSTEKKVIHSNFKLRPQIQIPFISTDRYHFVA